MVFNWTDYFELGKHLANSVPNEWPQEASTRSSLSRVYYAVYHHAHNHLTNKIGIILPEAHSHHLQIVEEIRKLEPSRDATRTANLLDGLRKLRSDADYHEEKDLKLQDAQKSIIDASQILSLLSSLTSN